ncbi:MAG: type I-E CRISPR-associated protein Cse1/CasA [Chloroflexi bacterium]|nr:type I-E CRISPR-associated protein Cse1/CasA [Chloroflexota bacterium]
MHNLLTDPLIRFNRSAHGRIEASLPEVYAALMRDDVEAFPALRPHQRHAWHAFLAQLGAIAIHRANLSEPPQVAEEWCRIIRGLTPDYTDDEPWQLVVDDITKPAFMQPHARSKDREQDYKSTVATPDELDMLITSKNHDLKSAVAARANFDDWIFALITLQTMEGFSGAGNYGISRMNGGLGSRPAFSLAPFVGGPGAHVRRDIIALLEYLPTLLSEYPMTDGGEALLWTVPWDGTQAEALLLNQLDPLYIEVCRRIRLRFKADGPLNGVRTSSRAARIEGKELKGRTGDPWTPANTSREGLPLTLASGGFTYKRVKEYLIDWERPPLLRPTRSEQDSSAPMRLVARGMVRGQGKTEGYHERSIAVRHQLKMAMLSSGGTQDLGSIAETRIEEVGTVQRILSHAIQVFAARGDSDKVSPEGRTLARPWLNRLDGLVDARFFEDLQDEFEAPNSEREGVHNRWLMHVVDHARGLLHDAADSLPCPAIHRYKAEVNAVGLFEGRLRGGSGLPFLFDQQEKEVEI